MLSPNAARRMRGQGMTEYLIIVALIAVAAIGVYGLFGSTVRNQVASMAAELGGQNGTEATARAATSGIEALGVSAENNKVGLDAYTNAASSVLD